VSPQPLSRHNVCPGSRFAIVEQRQIIYHKHTSNSEDLIFKEIFSLDLVTDKKNLAQAMYIRIHF
jgi:hypothetical protein